ncbi:MAG: tetratricopeptide repeat protein [Bacteroidetes bacterium]|jgi:serine/threonine-protein kinase|nr:tetratricopeptide repeat protein [Bacteroidota bacterium]
MATPSPSGPPAPLPPERWEAILSLFHDTLEQPAKAREAFLRAACDSDEALYHQVTSLLAADAMDDSFLATSRPLTTRLALEHSPMQDKRIGPYRVDEEIGQGGMGVVYRAHRDDVGTTVAIKFLRERFPSAERQHRFVTEQRTLGRLEHPGIARLLDAGTTDDGTPFFVMEYVDGVPVTDYCAAHDLDLSARLALFQQVGAAVRYAHAKAVVHRDLKPSNVLVTDTAAGPQVKLLDFGIAKLMADGEGTQTRTNERLLTPAYAAPEQVSEGGISTATDVYALGVLLYEMLTGKRPLDVSDTSLSEAVERILHQLPDAPSTAAAHPAGQAELPPVPPDALRGDLDTICEVCLRKAPERRYASAEALCGDITRFQTRRPITARPDTLTYRTGKFIRRHRAGVGATAATAVLIAALVTVYTLQLATERDRATEQAVVAESVVEFFVETLEEGNPNAVPGDTLTIYDIIDRAEERSDQLDNPLARANVLDGIGQVRHVYGQFDQADSLFTRSLDLRRAALAPDHPDVASSLNHLAQLYILQGDYAAADSLITQSLTILKQGRDVKANQLAEPTKILAHVRYRQGRYAEADSLYGSTVRIDRQANVLSDDSRADTHQEWGMAKFQRADYAGAAEQYRHAIGYFNAVYPEGHVATASALANLASIERVRGEYDAAVAGYQAALAMTQEILGPRHLNMAIIQNNLAVTYHRQGNVDTAAVMMAENVQLRQDLLGPNHPAVATAHNNLGEMLRDLGRLAEAESHFRTALTIRETALGPEHEKTVTSLNNIATLHEAQGAYETAEPMRRDVLARYRASLGAEHPRVALALSNLGSLLRKKGAYQEAESVLTEALDLRRRILPPVHDDLAQTLRALAALYVAREQWAAAEPLLREAHSIHQEVIPEHWQTAQTAVRLGQVLLHRDQLAVAESLLVDGYADLHTDLGPDAEATTEAESTLRALYAAWNRPERTPQVLDSLQVASTLLTQ